MGAWTLEKGGEEKTLAAWGISDNDLTRRRSNMGPDVVILRHPCLIDAVPIFAQNDSIIIRRDRVGNDTSGYSEGTIFFQGRADMTLAGEGAREYVTYYILGPWYDFARCVFQQAWKQFSGWSTPGDPNSDPTFFTRRTSELFLGMDVEGGYLNTGEQIREAVEWAATCGINVQVGTIDPAVTIPIYNVRDTTVAEVIQQMLRWTPDTICWFDYSTTPPTFHARSLANLADVSIDLSNSIKEIRLIPKYDLQLPAVCLRFKAVNTVDGRPSIVITEQNYPVNATGMELGASVHTIELAGSERNSLYADIESAAVTAKSADLAVRWNWWANANTGKEPSLASVKLDPRTIALTAATITDDEGNEINLDAYPYELLDGQVASWMNVGSAPAKVIDASVKATVTYDLYRVASGWLKTNASKLLIQKGCKRELSCRVRLTNAPSGTYTALGSYVAGESVPSGLAQAIYDAHASLQYEGTVALVGEEVPSNIGMGNTVTISIGATTYSRILVQQISENVGRGTMVLSLGPASHLGVPDLIELLRVNRFRLVYNNPATRTTGDGGANGLVTLGNNLPRENTTRGTGMPDEHSLSSTVGTNKAGVVCTSSRRKTFIIEVQNDDPASASYGLPITTEGRVEMALSDAGGKELKIREWDVCVVVDGVTTTKKARFLSTEAYS